ncbi:unnamed protein product [Moneuplotes crassus]|uniref:Uncharacterized protein n=1 Tax=Euplotes crassus TaxID=5936 RepID=A0AAD2DB25_EUPCR|nr:unnamed protein product [Moneuplotes crassus]
MKLLKQKKKPEELPKIGKRKNKYINGEIRIIESKPFSLESKNKPPKKKLKHILFGKNLGGKNAVKGSTFDIIPKVSKLSENHRARILQVLKQQKNSRDGELYLPNKLKKFVKKEDENINNIIKRGRQTILPAPKEIISANLSQSVDSKEKFLELLKVLQDQKTRKNGSLETVHRFQANPYQDLKCKMNSTKNLSKFSVNGSRNKNIFARKISASQSCQRHREYSESDPRDSLNKSVKILECSRSNVAKSSLRNDSRMPSLHKTLTKKKRYLNDNLSREFHLEKVKSNNDIVLRQKEEDLETEIKKMTMNSDNNEDIVGIDLKGLFQKFPIVIISKFQKRLECIQDIKPAHKNIKIAADLKYFHIECQTWLKRAIASKGSLSDDFLQEIKFTEGGDMFKGEHNGKLPDGLGLCISRKNQLIQAKFSLGVIQNGSCRILYPNGEYYEGSVKYGGLRHGSGRHFYSNGDIYDGGFIKNHRVGKSRMLLADGSEYIGQFIADESDGHGIFTDKHGNRYMSIVDEDEFSKSKRGERSASKKDSKSGYFYRLRLYGIGEIKFKNGNTYSGKFKGGKRDGYGEMSYITPLEHCPKDIGEYKGNWKRDKRDGKGVMNYSNGSIFEGEYRNDHRYKGIYRSTSGEVYNGKFYNDEFHGKGKLTFPDSTVIEGEFYKGQLQGTGKIIKNSAAGTVIFQGLIVDNEIGNRGKMTYPNGDVYEGYFKDGEKHGFGVLTSPNGYIYEGRWEDGVKDGKGREYDPEKSQIFEGMFSGGSKIIG